jgi:hypothetical protein
LSAAQRANSTEGKDHCPHRLGKTQDLPRKIWQTLGVEVTIFNLHISFWVCLDVKCLKIRFVSVTFFSAVDLLSNGSASYNTDKNRLIFSVYQSLFFFLCVIQQSAIFKSQTVSSRQILFCLLQGLNPLSSAIFVNDVWTFFGPIDPLHDVNTFSSTVFLSRMLGFFVWAEKTHILLPCVAINYCSPPKKAQLIFQRENPFGSPPKNVGFFPIYTCPPQHPCEHPDQKKRREK